MRMSVTKVKPVVVKHVLNDQVMSIYDIKVSHLSIADSIRPTWSNSTLPILSGTNRHYLSS